MIKKQTIYICDNCGVEVKEDDAVGWIEVSRRGSWPSEWNGVIIKRPSPFGLFCSEDCHRDKVVNLPRELEEYHDMIQNGFSAIMVDDSGTLYAGNK